MKTLLLSALLLASFNVSAQCNVVTVFDYATSQYYTKQVCVDKPVNMPKYNSALINNLANPRSSFMDSYERAERLRLMQRAYR